MKACSAREYQCPASPLSALRLPTTNTRCSPPDVASGRLSRLEPANNEPSTSCANGRYVGDSLTSTEHGFASGARYTRIACVDVTPRTCRLLTAPSAMEAPKDAVKMIFNNLISVVLTLLSPAHSLVPWRSLSGCHAPIPGGILRLRLLRTAEPDPTS